MTSMTIEIGMEPRYADMYSAMEQAGFKFFAVGESRDVEIRLEDDTGKVLDTLNTINPDMDDEEEVCIYAADLGEFLERVHGRYMVN